MAEGDIFQFLQTLPDESRSIVTAFHILEHIRFSDMVDLIDQAVRILKPGGIVIFETPNPKNLFVSSNNFYLDPTHLNPIPSEFLAFLVEARGPMRSEGASALSVSGLLPSAGIRLSGSKIHQRSFLWFAGLRGSGKEIVACTVAKVVRKNNFTFFKSVLWGGPPGPRGTPRSRSVKFVIAVQKADQGVGSGPGVPPTTPKGEVVFARSLS